MNLLLHGPESPFFPPLFPPFPGSSRGRNFPPLRNRMEGCSEQSGNYPSFPPLFLRRIHHGVLPFPLIWEAKVFLPLPFPLRKTFTLAQRSPPPSISSSFFPFSFSRFLARVSFQESFPLSTVRQGGTASSSHYGAEAFSDRYNSAPPSFPLVDFACFSLSIIHWKAN